MDVEMFMEGVLVDIKTFMLVVGVLVVATNFMVIVGFMHEVVSATGWTMVMKLVVAFVF